MPVFEFTGTNPEQFDKLIGVMFEKDANSDNIVVDGTNLLIASTQRTIVDVISKIKTNINKPGNKRLLIPYSCSSPSNLFNLMPESVNYYMPDVFRNLSNRELPYQHYVLFDIEIINEVINVTLYDSSYGSRINGNEIKQELENELGQINYRTNALMTQASSGNDSVNCGKYIMMYILFIANIERDNSQENDFVMVSHDNLSSMSNLQKLRDVRDILFTRFQEMMDLDNQANIRKEELILSVSSLSSEDEFEVLDFNSDSSEKDSEFSIENIRQNLDQLERFNLIALRETAGNINQIFSSRGAGSSYVAQVQNINRGSGGMGR